MKKFFLIFAMFLCFVNAFNLDSGVTKEFAIYRKKTIDNIKYNLEFTIPESVDKRITGKISIDFFLKDNSQGVILDFNTESKNLLSTMVNNTAVDVQIENGHLYFKQEYVVVGNNTITIDFLAGNNSLNRYDEYLYSLLVPDRASTVFPCFDQPDLKAKYKLKLDVPKDWIAISNGALLNKNENYYQFDETEPISTYLFSFVAGKFEVINKTINDRTFNFYYRESNKEKVDRNIDEIFKLHTLSLDWLEDYTELKYPFSKFDFVAIPSFQYSGMEHPGNIYYNAGKLFLDENPSINQLIDRANLIAHETAHIWFGDYVTMQWFDDVWLKEVFANFMAGKIINPLFPNTNHKLKFLYANFPAAFSIDRTKGTHPIKQELENMKYAGTLYGPIIYQKSPIVMQQLENLIGEEKFREAVVDYISKYKYSNSDWSDLVNIFDSKSDLDIKKWSDIWVNQEGRPKYTVDFKTINRKRYLHIKQFDSQRKNRIWNQNAVVLVSNGDKYDYYPVYLNSDFIKIELKNKKIPDFIFLNSDGNAYGDFQFDKKSRTYLMKNINKLKDDLLRGNIWIQFYEDFLNAQIKPKEFIDLSINSLNIEKDQLIFDKIRSYILTCYNTFLTDSEKKSYSEKLEIFFEELTEKRTDLSEKKNLFKSYCSIAQSDLAIEKIYKYWNKELLPVGFSLSEDDYIYLANTLAIKNHKNYNEILDKQFERLSNIEKKNKFTYLRNSLSNDVKKIDDFFNNLLNYEYRKNESWVIEALNNLHHPSRIKHSIRYLEESLEIIEEIQKTGDIFFPQRWLSAILSNYNTKDAKNIVNSFLQKKKLLSYRLRNKILQSTDILFRASEYNKKNK